MAAQSPPAPAGPLTPEDRRKLEWRFTMVMASLGKMTETEQAKELKRLTGKTSFAELSDAECQALKAALKPTKEQRGRIWHLARELGLRGGIEGEEMRVIIRELFPGSASEHWHLARPQAVKLIASLQARLRFMPATLASLNRSAAPPPRASAEARHGLS